ncbi:MAG: hypothetical protein ISS82_03580 [Nanoarchaeota archaeon]|nr:hypothetical protein [Nanoarchaeota archaeon]
MRGTDISSMKKEYRTRNEGDFPDELTIKLQKEWDLKYGENPNQHAAIYFLDEINGINASKIARLTNIRSVRSDGKGKGGLSLTNTMDISRALNNLKFYPNPTVVIMKHNIVSGFATQTNPNQSLTDLFRLARDSDLRSNFGGTLAMNLPLDMETTEAMYELLPKFFTDVLAAPEYEEGVLGYIEKKSKNIRIGQFSNLDCLPKFQGDEIYGLLSLKEMPGGRIGVQDIYLTSIKGPENLVTDPMVINDDKKHIIARDPTPDEAKDLLIAWYLNIEGARSNGVVMIRNGVLVSMGSGQVERVGAVEQAIVKGMQKAMDREGIKYDPLMGIQGYGQLINNPFNGAVCSSDAFFPFRDSIDLLARVGVTAVVQPYGSLNDHEVIDAANKHNIAMPATLERCFGHF